MLSLPQKFATFTFVHLVGLAIFSFAMTNVVFAASNTFVTQKITPLECTVSEISNGNSSNLSFSPNCGPSNPPVPTPRSQPSGGTPPILRPSFPTSTPPTSSGGGSSELITDNDAIYSPWGLTIIAKEGIKYRFYLDSTQRDERYFFIKTISENGALLVFMPGNSLHGMKPGDKLELDLNEDNMPDIRLTLQYVDDKAGVAVLRAVVYKTIDTKERIQESILAQVLTGGITVGALASVAHFYHRVRLPQLPRHWKAPHLYHR